MPFTTWIRDILGIRKDVVDTKRTKLEIERLEVEKRERDLITPATLDDVRKYDPNIQKLQLKIGERRKRGYGASVYLKNFVHRHSTATVVFILIVILLFVLFGLAQVWISFR
jgi:hypothetical protein